jgi:hypothetical protein
MAVTRSCEKEGKQVKLWRDGGFVLVCDRVSSLVTYMKVKKEGMGKGGSLNNLAISFLFTMAIYIPLRVTLSGFFILH